MMVARLEEVKTQALRLVTIKCISYGCTPLCNTCEGLASLAKVLKLKKKVGLLRTHSSFLLKAIVLLDELYLS